MTLCFRASLTAATFLLSTMVAGSVCAPRIGKRRAGNGLEPYEPQCKLGGAAPVKSNGCPYDAAVPPYSKAFPICLAKAKHRGEPDPYVEGDFHCLLVCPCMGRTDECSEASHWHCPRGARCERGETRNRAHGVCTY